MQDYLKGIAQKFARIDETTSKNREMIYRTDFENLLKEIFQADGRIKQINHDATSDNGNKPDFVVSKGGVSLLYIEAKDIGVSLDKIEKSEQMNRYFGYDNLILTDYLEFRFYRNGMKYGEPIFIANYKKESRVIVSKPENFELLKKTILDFASSHREPIKSGVHLARIMGGKAQRIRDNVREMLNDPNEKYQELLRMRDYIKQNLISDFNDESFSDMYAQTLVYGLFAARYNDKSSETFSRFEALGLVAKTSPFLGAFFGHIAGQSFPERLRVIVDELCEVFLHAEIEKILHDFYGKEKDNKDPIIHFYEDFLREYDAKKKTEMGVFYTPRPVVQFIIRAVDDILKKEFGLSKGLADITKIRIEKKEKNDKEKEISVQKEYHKVQILDVATGTGTFLNEVIEHIHKDFEGQKGRWPAYVKNDLLPRLHGFELMMASYTIAHLKLGMTLRDTNAGEIDNRFGIYLTNTLESPVEYSNQMKLFGIMDSIAEESRSASKVKSEYPIMCVIGNPPYSGESMNAKYTGNDVYKVEIGGREKLKERNSKWVNDDYVKFIRFAESLIEKNQEGVVGMITSHGYIDNPTFRGMRWHLRSTFDKIYVLDLHGNSNKKETSPDGAKDENIFDIKTGVSIILGLKKSNSKDKKLAQIYKTDLFGLREDKFEKLDSFDLNKIKWIKLPETTDTWILEGEGKDEYKEGFSVFEIFPINSVGVVTSRDEVLINNNKDDLLKNVADFFNINTEERFVQKISYRPFDDRFIYFDTKLIERSREKVMNQFVDKKNIGLIAPRQSSYDWAHIFISSNIAEFNLLSTAAINGSGNIFPLYLYESQNEKIPNLNKETWDKINEIAGKTTPENVLDYIYAVLHSPKYREKYKEFLKIDFPRVPYPKDKKHFFDLAKIGEELRRLHLMESSKANRFITTYPEVGDDVVEKVKYENGNVYINDKQYFGNVPEVAWSFYIGGYQPAQKWLKDRKGRKLSNEDIEHYQKIIVVLVETGRVMREIDKIK